MLQAYFNDKNVCENLCHSYIRHKRYKVEEIPVLCAIVILFSVFVVFVFVWTLGYRGPGRRCRVFQFCGILRRVQHLIIMHMHWLNWRDFSLWLFRTLKVSSSGDVSLKIAEDRIVTFFFGFRFWISFNYKFKNENKKKLLPVLNHALSSKF